MNGQNTAQLEHALRIKKSTWERQIILKQLYHLRLEEQQAASRETLDDRSPSQPKATAKS
jgi:hypothetical protein